MSARARWFRQVTHFTAESLQRLVRESGLAVQECVAYLLNPLPNEMMSRLDISDELFDGLYELGRDYPELACQIYVQAAAPLPHLSPG